MTLHFRGSKDLMEMDGAVFIHQARKKSAQRHTALGVGTTAQTYLMTDKTNFGGEGARRPRLQIS